MSRLPLRLALIEAAKQLDAAGVPSPRTDAELLASHLLGVETHASRADSVGRSRGHRGVRRVGCATGEADSVAAHHRSRVDGQTSTSLSGRVSFIPRPETELLMGWALSFLEGCGSKPPVVLDPVLRDRVYSRCPSPRPVRTPSFTPWRRSPPPWRGRVVMLPTAEAAGDTPIHLHQGDVTDRKPVARARGRRRSGRFQSAVHPRRARNCSLRSWITTRTPRCSVAATVCPSSNP